MLVYIHSEAKSMVLEDIPVVPQRLSVFFESENNRKILEAKEKLERNSKFDIFLVGRDMILGWDKPGISPPDGNLYPVPAFSFSYMHRYKMTIPKYFKGKDLRAELTSHIVGDFRL